MENQIVDDLEMILDDMSDSEVSISEDLLENILESAQSKPNINNLPYETAVNLLRLTDYQYYQLQLYIEEQGQLVSIYEIEAIEGFSADDRRRIAPRVRVERVEGKRSFFKNFFAYSRQSLLLRYGQVLEQQAGYDTTRSNHYAGSPGHVCFRYNFSTQNKLFIKISGEKDAGEQFFRGEQKYGFDFYSGSISIKEMGIVKSAVVGDYRLNFGQGLALGSSFLSGKGGGPAAIRRFETGIRAIAPTNENDFLRGGAITMGKTKFTGTLFAGRQFGSTLNNLGANLTYRHALFKIGCRIVTESCTDTAQSTVGGRIKSSLVPNSVLISADYQVILKRHLLFGEFAVTQDGKIGAVQSAIFNLTPVFSIAAVFRHYDRGFHSPLGSGFGANSHNTGETGLYLTSSWTVNRNCVINFYGDYYRLTWTSYRTDAPIAGMDIGVAGQYNFNRYSNLSLAYSFRDKAQNGDENPHYKTLEERQKHRFRLVWNNTPHSFLRLKTGLQFLLNQTSNEQPLRKGFLIYQDAAFDISNWGLAIHARLAYFDTDSYDERLYAYENDVYYAFTIGSYYYQGVRGYLVLRYKYNWISLWLRFSHTYYTDRHTISSGLTQIDKPHKSEIRLQVMFNI